MFKHRVNLNIEDLCDCPSNFRFGSIYEYNTNLDIEHFKQLDEQSKREKILQLLYSAFISLANEFDWDKELINDAYTKSIQDKFQFVYYTDFKVNRNKKYQGRIRINLVETIVKFTAEVLDLETKDLREKELLQTEEWNFSWWRSIREFAWIDSENFGLKMMKGEAWITTNIITNEVREIFNPKKRDLNQLENFIAQLKNR